MSNIVVVFPKLEDAKAIKNILIRSGFTVSGICTSGAQALSLADNLGSGIIISGYKLPDMVYEELKHDLPEGFELLLIVSQMRFEECRGMGVVCLSMPLKVNDIIRTVEMMLTVVIRRWKKIKSTPKKRSDEDKIIITQAKKILMETNNMTEIEAHRYIQKSSMDSGMNMAEYAKVVLKVN